MLAGLKRTEGVVEHSELFQKGELQRAAAAEGSQGGCSLLSKPRKDAGFSPAPGRQPLLDRIGHLRLGWYPGGQQCPTRQGSTDGLTPSALYARRCFPNGVRVRGKECTHMAQD